MAVRTELWSREADERERCVPPRRGARAARPGAGAPARGRTSAVAASLIFDGVANADECGARSGFAVRVIVLSQPVRSNVGSEELARCC